MAITLDQVRCFIAVAEELHFGKAAERLAMTQPPLSRQIQRLERSVGAVLLDRDNRRVVLTPAGLAFLEDCYRVLSSLDGATAHAQRVERGSAGTLRLGFTAVSAIGLVGPLLGLLGEELPDIEVVLQEAVTGIQVDGIRRGELDLGLARPPFDTSALESTVVAREALLAVVPASHPLAAETGPLGPDAFDGLPVISYHPQRAQYFHELTVRFLFNGQPRITQRVQQILTAVLLVAAGQGVALVPASARALRVDGVVFKALTDFGSGHPDCDPAKPVELHAIWARGRLSPMLRQVLHLVERSAVHLDEIGN